MGENKRTGNKQEDGKPLVDKQSSFRSESVQKGCGNNNTKRKELVNRANEIRTHINSIRQID